MADKTYLRNHGWKYCEKRHVYQWRDPISLLSWYTFKDALFIQKERSRGCLQHLRLAVSEIKRLEGARK